MSSFQLLHFLYYRGSTASTVDLKEGSVIHSRWVGWGVVSVNDRPGSASPSVRRPASGDQRETERDRERWKQAVISFSLHLSLAVTVSFTACFPLISLLTAARYTRVSLG